MDPEGETNTDRAETARYRTPAGHRRCQSTDMIFGLQCSKRKRHNKQEHKPLHQHGAVVWADRGAEQPTQTSKVFWSDREAEQPAKAAKADDAQVDPRTTMFSVFVEPHLFARVPKMPLDEWWLAAAKDEIARTVPKVREYGATDLRDTGLMLARTMRREVSDEEAIELGIFFYLLGKVSRWQSAIERGDRPSSDTLFDIGAYVRMAQRTRYAGGFPGEDTEEDQT